MYGRPVLQKVRHISVQESALFSGVTRRGILPKSANYQLTPTGPNNFPQLYPVPYSLDLEMNLLQNCGICYKRNPRCITKCKSYVPAFHRYITKTFEKLIVISDICIIVFIFVMKNHFVGRNFYDRF